MEKIILFATDNGLGTCWLGGTFTRSRFAKIINPRNEEIIPAVTAIGHASNKPRKIDLRIRKTADSDNRLPWRKLFFEADSGKPLDIKRAGDFSLPLEMVRLGPSASNKQPWRIVRSEDRWDFFLYRTPGYQDNPYSTRLGIADLQRVDMGIAMCHFELTADEAGLGGSWEKSKPGYEPPIEGLEYLVSWI